MVRLNPKYGQNKTSGLQDIRAKPGNFLVPNFLFPVFLPGNVPLYSQLHKNSYLSKRILPNDCNSTKKKAKHNNQHSRCELLTLSFTSTPYHIVKVIELYGNFRQNLIKSSCLLATPSLTLRRQHDFSSEKLWKSLLVWKTLGFLFISGLFFTADIRLIHLLQQWLQVNLCCKTNQKKCFQSKLFVLQHNVWHVFQTNWEQLPRPSFFWKVYCKKNCKKCSTTVSQI